MSAIRRSRNHPVARGRGRRSPGGSRRLGLLTAALVGVCALVLPASPAFGEGSVDINLGSDAEYRHGLTAPLLEAQHVYAQAGETIQLASSAMGVPGGVGNIRLFAPGDDPDTATPIWDCNADDPGTGRIGSRAAELAGPEPSAAPAAYTPCEFTVPPGGDGIYSVRFGGPVDNLLSPPSTVGAPFTGLDQNRSVSMWDITVRDVGGAVTPGRAFWYYASHNTSGVIVPGPSGQYEAFVYTRTGYEYQFDLFDHQGQLWIIAADDRGVVDIATGERLFASAPLASGGTAPANTPDYLGDDEFRHPLFYNRVDPVVITGPGGLGATRGFSDVPIAPGSTPLSTAFTGSGGQADATNRGSGGTLDFSWPVAMASLDYALEIDTDGNGTFGDGNDVVDTGTLSESGSSTYAWDGRDAAGNVPGCGSYSYRVRSTLSEVHFPQIDVERTGGIQIERLSLPSDPDLGGPFAASYNDINPYPPGGPVTNAAPSTVTNGDSSVQPFHAWTGESGDGDYVDTWTRLPEVVASGSLQVLCNDPGIVKSGPTTVEPGGQVAWTLTVTNHGPGTSSGATVEDSIPAGVTNVSTSTPGCSVADGTVTCTLGELAAGASTEIAVTGTAPSAPSTCFTNAARVTGQNDHNQANNTSTWTTCTPPPPPQPARVTIDKRASDSRVRVGETVTYTAVVRNEGPGVAYAVRVVDRVPAALDARSASSTQGTCEVSGNSVSCALGTMAVGQEVTVTVRAVAQRAGRTTNTARVDSTSCTTHPCDDDPAEVTIVKPRLRITKQVSKRVLRAGQTTSYRIRVSNPSDVRLRNVQTCDRLPAGLVYVGSKPKAKLSKGKHCWTLKRLGAGKSKTYRVTVRALAGASGRLVNTATATSPDARRAQARRAVRVVGGAVSPGGVTG